MPRRSPPDRLARLIDCATEVFIALGYRRTQMADVAAALGVAKGTVYLYVESKAALFDLVLRHADATHPPPLPARLPVPTPRPGSTLALVRQRLGEAAVAVHLARALTGPPAAAVTGELAGVIDELYTAMAAQRTAIQLLDRCAVDYPELAAVWFERGRGDTVAALHRYLATRAAAGHLRPLADVALAARLILETVAMWAVHRHWDPAPQSFDETTVQPAVVAALVAALVPDDPSPAPRARRATAKR
jgi:AcrR family transcriptional regulator